MDMSSNDSLFATGRRAKNTLRRDIASYVEYNTIELDGVILKRVNTAIIDRRKTTYFKCKNMKTPYRVSGICHFSGRIADFPDNLQIEILSDHNPACSYLKRNFNGIRTSYIAKNEKSYAKKNTLVKKTRKKRRKKAIRHKLSTESFKLVHREELGIPNPVEKVIRRLKIPKEIDQNSKFEQDEIYVQLSTQADLDREREAQSRNPNLFNNIII